VHSEEATTRSLAWRGNAKLRWLFLAVVVLIFVGVIIAATLGSR
jgi:hypothetical protein